LRLSSASNACLSNSVIKAGGDTIAIIALFICLSPLGWEGVRQMTAKRTYQAKQPWLQQFSQSINISLLACLWGRDVICDARGTFRHMDNPQIRDHKQSVVDKAAL